MKNIITQDECWDRKQKGVTRVSNNIKYKDVDTVDSGGKTQKLEEETIRMKKKRPKEKKTLMNIDLIFQQNESVYTFFNPGVDTLEILNLL